MSLTTMAADFSATYDDGGCWSCGEPATRPDGLCADCGTIDPCAVPDIKDPSWKGNTKALEAIFAAPPTARCVS